MGRVALPDSLQGGRGVIRVIEGVGILLGIVVVVGLIFAGAFFAGSYEDIGKYLKRRKKQREARKIERRSSKPIPAAHVCKEFTQWTIVKEIPVYTYPDPDAGRDLPDRIDGVVKRECVVCHLPQTKTVRGL